MDENQTLVIDPGSSNIQAGIAGQDAPKVVFPSVVGFPKRKMIGFDTKDAYVGDEANSKRGILNLKFPIEHGVITNWEEMEKLLNYTFYNELRVSPDEQPVLMAETPLNPKENREKMCELLFEKFSCPSIYLANNAVLSSCASGLVTSLIVTSGDGVTHTVPVHEGNAISEAIKTSDIAGKDLTNYLMKLLNDKGNSYNTNAEKEIIQQAKEKICFAAFDFDQEMEKSKKGENDKTFELPDGTTLTFGSERFQCVEALFSPKNHGFDCTGIAEMAYLSVQKSDVNLRHSFYQNIVLSGASTLFEGFSERFKREMSNNIIDVSARVMVVAPRERKYSAWIGGSIFASLSIYKEKFVSNEEFLEFGPSIVHKKCQ
jgi:actin, other eukaryote